LKKRCHFCNKRVKLDEDGRCPYCSIIPQKPKINRKLLITVFVSFVGLILLGTPLSYIWMSPLFGMQVASNFYLLRRFFLAVFIGFIILLILLIIRDRWAEEKKQRGKVIRLIGALIMLIVILIGIVINLIFLLLVLDYGFRLWLYFSIVLIPIPYFIGIFVVLLGIAIGFASKNKEPLLV